MDLRKCQNLLLKSFQFLLVVVTWKEYFIMGNTWSNRRNSMSSVINEGDDLYEEKVWLDLPRI
jgi:hypothetical protein